MLTPHRLDDTEIPETIKKVISGEIWALGNRLLLERTAIGICGSRDASPSALEWAYKFGSEAARCGIVVVSGYARGVDRQAHKGALDAGGSTIAVLPDGINHFRLAKELRGSADLGANLLALSMFKPDDSWQTWRAMERNSLIVGLSVGLFVIEARERGGTIHAAHECVRQRKRLWAIAYSKDLPGREGNRKLIAGSAVPLQTFADLGRALRESMARPPAAVKQLVLNLVGEEATVAP